MPKTLLERLADQIDPVDAAYFDLADLVAERVGELLDERGWTQRELARRLGKAESYVSRLLSGGQNATLKTLAQLQHALGAQIVTTPAQVRRDVEDGDDRYADLRETLAAPHRHAAPDVFVLYDPEPALPDDWPSPGVPRAQTLTFNTLGAVGSGRFAFASGGGALS